MIHSKIIEIESVDTYLLDPKGVRQCKNIAKAHGLQEERWEEFLDLTDAVIDKRLEVNQMDDFLARAFGLGPKEAEALAADVAGYRLLPLEEYLHKVPEQIINWGGVLDEYPPLRIKKVLALADDIAGDLVEELKLELSETLTKRFEFLVSGYLSKERAKDATSLLLERPITIGGLGFNEEMVGNLMAVLDRKLQEHPELHINRQKRVVKEVEKIEEEVEESATPKRVVSKRVVKAWKKKPAAKKKKNVVVASVESKSTKSVKETRTKKVMRALPPVKVKHVTEKRLPSMGNLLDDFDPSRVAGADLPERGPLDDFDPAMVAGHHLGSTGRTALEQARAQLKKKDSGKKKARISQKRSVIKMETPLIVSSAALVETGSTELSTSVPIISGIALHDHEHEEVRTHERKLQARYTVGRGRKETIAREIKRIVEELVPVVGKKINNKALAALTKSYLQDIRGVRQMERILTERHKLTQKKMQRMMSILLAAKDGLSKKTELDMHLAASSADAVVLNEIDSLNRRHAVLTKSAPGAIKRDDISPARISASRSKGEEIEAQKSRLTKDQHSDADKLLRPKKAKARLSKASTPPSKKGLVRDIVRTQKLVGPIQELARMDSITFRRLSSDAGEAADKILDKIDLLESASYEERIQGVKAWRKSPITKLYLEMTQDALTEGVGIAEVAADRRNKGKESLSPAEIQSIVRVNRAIAF
jgi:hypothetical protein